MSIAVTTPSAATCERRSRSSDNPRGRLADGTANPIDLHVGARIRLRRTLLGLNQEALADALGVSYQQVQKYERGGNRVGASRLYDIAKILGVPVSFFFDDMADGTAATSPAALAAGSAPAPIVTTPDIMASTETLSLVRAYYRASEQSRRQVLQLLLTIAMSIAVTTPSAATRERRSRSSDNPRGRLADGTANPIDLHVGARIRLRRTLLGLNQEALADALGVSYQQVQKYERGGNRVGASRLYDIAQILNVPVSFFYDDLPPDAAATSPAALAAGSAPAPIVGTPDIMATTETLSLVRAYYRASEQSRRQVLQLLLTLAEPARSAAA